jgi:alanyl-tRNA synthetase
MRAAAQKMQSKMGSEKAGFIMLIGISNEKPIIVCMSNDKAIEKGLKSGDIIKKVANILGGGAGGRPEFASGGGNDKSKISDALKSAKEFIKNL